MSAMLYVLYCSLNLMQQQYGPEQQLKIEVSSHMNSVESDTERFGVNRMILGQTNINVRVFKKVRAKEVKKVTKNNGKELKGCSTNDAVIRYLGDMRVYPNGISFRPEFSYDVNEYEINVDYNQITLQILATTMHCDVITLYGPDYVKAKFVNITVGLGINRFKIFVGKETKTRSWLLNTYVINIFRKQGFDPEFGLRRHDIAMLNVCKLQQSCNLILYPSIKCDLQKSNRFSLWLEFQRFHRNLPVCSSSLSEGNGRWYVPCKSCSQWKNTCDWSKAVWKPKDCRQPHLSRKALEQCFDGKKILFIGDSTNRGMMYYMIERLNSSLYKWDKTHGLDIMTDVNEGRTLVAFVYYPQFWLQNNRRPMFEKTVYQLLNRVGPLHNDSRTVVVVGGVQWLSVNHLQKLERVLNRKGLGGSRKIVKTLGAGFNQKVHAVHHLALEEQRKLVKHNEELRNFALGHGMQVVDTLNVTFARYQDFYPGKCGCHFHQVEQLRPSSSYHVVGDVNAKYTEMLMNSICAEYIDGGRIS
ncbi:CPED1 (predicted) [Pycnogonum litorale]